MTKDKTSYIKKQLPGCFLLLKPVVPSCSKIQVPYSNGPRGGGALEASMPDAGEEHGKPEAP